MKIRDGGKEHQASNVTCNACAQEKVGGGPLNNAGIRHPYRDISGNPPCGGLVHSEVFQNGNSGWEIIYRCDKCLAFC